jgi:hypothetical protein
MLEESTPGITEQDNMDGNRNSPLSGDVTQAINPWTWFARIAGSQMGFINIHQTTSTDTELERQIVENVAGYGHQLGRITEALSVLIDQADTSSLDQRDQKALEAFRSMAERIEQTKTQRRERTSPLNALDDVLTALAALREQDPQRYRREVEKIRTVLDLDDDSGPTVTAVSGQGS